jgi:hypothetical protein
MILEGESEGMISFGKPKRRRNDSTKVCPKEIEWEGAYLISQAQDKYRCLVFVNAVMYLGVE